VASASRFAATTDPNAAVAATLADGTAFVAECAVRGRNVGGNTVWHRISSPANGWISDYYTCRGRICRPGSSSRMLVFVEDATESITSADVELVNWFGHRLG
jgi:hypothetical protein